MRGRALLAACAVSAVVVILTGSRAGAALVVSQPLSQPDVIVSLASHEWERLPATAAMARRFPHALVVLTQPGTVTPFNCHDCANRVHRLELLGIWNERVRILPLLEGGTYGEALAVRRFVEETRLTRIVVVTSPYHTRRSLATFRSVLARVDAEVGVEPATATSPAMPARWWMTPYDRAYVRYEWAGVAYYMLRYGVGWR